jgi:hypothetical protein
MVRHGRLHPWFLGLVLALAPLRAGALELPGLDGHMTDPHHKLGSAKASIEERLGKIQDETHIDVAGWISDLPEDQVEARGSDVYRRWNIGKNWDGGIFLVFPASGPVHVIQDSERPTLSDAARVKLVATDSPTDKLDKRALDLAEEARRLILPKMENQARPLGTSHPEKGPYYVIAAAALALVGAWMSLRRKSTP